MKRTRFPPCVSIAPGMRILFTRNKKYTCVKVNVPCHMAKLPEHILHMRAHIQEKKGGRGVYPYQTLLT